MVAREKESDGLLWTELSMEMIKTFYNMVSVNLAENGKCTQCPYTLIVYIKMVNFMLREYKGPG